MLYENKPHCLYRNFCYANQQPSMIVLKWKKHNLILSRIIPSEKAVLKLAEWKCYNYVLEAFAWEFTYTEEMAPWDYNSQETDKTLVCGWRF